MSAARNRGTAAETAVVGYLQETFWPYAERRALAGALDRGDITGTPGLCWEVKSTSGKFRLSEWVAETVVERANAKADYGILVIKPPGLGGRQVGRWFACLRGDEFDRLMGALAAEPQATVPMIKHGSPIAFSTATLRVAMATAATLAPSTIYVGTLRPPGTKEVPDQWFRVMTLECVTMLLHAAGYGTITPVGS